MKESFFEDSGLPVHQVRICSRAHDMLLRAGVTPLQFFVYAQLTSLRDKKTGQVGIKYPVYTKDFKYRLSAKKSQGKAAVPPPNPTQIEWAILKLCGFGLVDIVSGFEGKLKTRICVYLKIEHQYDLHQEEAEKERKERANSPFGESFYAQ